MTSIFPILKKIYWKKVQETPKDHIHNQLPCLERMGKSLVSFIFEVCQKNSQQYIEESKKNHLFDKFQQELVEKLKLKDKKEIHMIIGQYASDNQQYVCDFNSILTECGMLFAKVIQSEDNKYVNSKDTKPLHLCKPSKDHTVINNFQLTKDDQQSTLAQSPVSFKLNKTLIAKQITLEQSKDLKQNEEPISLIDHDDKEQLLLEYSDFQFEAEEEEENQSQKNDKDLTEDYFKETVDYLLKLSSPQGQLTYFWQHLKWQGFQTFYESCRNEKNQWVCTAQIGFPKQMIDEYNHEFMKKTQCSTNKKQARQLACMDLLKSLCLEYPEDWMIYKHLKEEKKLVIAPLEEKKKQDQIDLINDRHCIINIDKIEKLFKHKKTDIRKMMEKISAKAELNTLLQQLPGRVTSPKIAKKIEDGNWKVPVRIEYKTADDIQENRPPKIYERTVVFPNTKIAEEEAYMEAIIEMYQKNPDLFQKIQAIKIAKKIKDPEKKVPLLRYARIAKQDMR